MNVTVAGGGNIGTLLAAHAADKGHRVTVFSSRPESFSDTLSVISPEGKTVVSGKIAGASNDPAGAFSGAELVLVTLPAFAMESLSEKIEPFANEKMFICLVPGTGGGECAFRRCAEKGAVIFGIQRVPAIARLIEYGRSVCGSGYRGRLTGASLDPSRTEECCALVGGIMDMPCDPLPNYLNITMTPSNPILHTCRLYSMFRDYGEGVTYPRVPLFYEDWDDFTSRLIFRCDSELLATCKGLGMELSGVRPLQEHYESPTPEAMTRKISSIPAFKGLTTRMLSKDGGFIPDLGSRYFTADFPYGLSILVQLSELAGTEAPTMRTVLGWYESLTGQKNGFSFADYGITDLDGLRRYYLEVRG